MVAEFIVQSESATLIEEAIKILMSWNPNWKPEYYYSEAEIAAVETCFSGVIVYLFDFHREQAWERWTRDSKHGLKNWIGLGEAIRAFNYVKFMHVWCMI